MEKNNEVKRGICEILLKVLDSYGPDIQGNPRQFGKRLKNKIELALPKYTVYVEKDKPSSFQKHSIGIWGNGIEYNDSLYFCTYNSDWHTNLLTDVRNRIKGLDKDKANEENLKKIEPLLALLEDEAKRINGKCKDVLEQGGVEYVPKETREKFPALFGDS